MMGIKITCDECGNKIQDKTYDICKLCSPRIIVEPNCSVKHLTNKHLEEIVTDKLYEFYERVREGKTQSEKLIDDILKGKQHSLVTVVNLF